MIQIDINPYIFSIGSLKIGWGLIIGIAAVMLAIPLSIVLARPLRLKRVHIFWLCSITVICGYLGALLFSIIESLLAYHSIATFNFSLRADGLPIAVTIATLIYARINNLDYWPLLDIGAISLILYMAVYRIGCVLVGCCYGLPCDQPWAIIYTNPNSPAPLDIAIYPTQFFHLIWNFLVLAIVWLSRKEFKVVGTLGLFAWTLYFAGDFVIRFFRGNEPPVLGLSLSEITDILAIIAAIYFFTVRYKTFNPKRAIDS